MGRTQPRGRSSMRRSSTPVDPALRQRHPTLIALANPSLRRLAITVGVCNLGRFAMIVGFGVFAYQVSGVAGVSIVGFCQALSPMMLVPLLANGLDRFGRVSVAIGADVALSTGLSTHCPRATHISTSTASGPG